MKKNNKSVEVTVKPRRLTRAERRYEKNMQKASEQLENYYQAAEFHKKYLEIELEIEEAKLQELQERIDALKTPEIETVETVETVGEAEYDAFGHKM